MNNKKLKVEEVAMRAGVSVQTINRWYKFKAENPDNPLSENLPDYDKLTMPGGITRLWDLDDVWKIIEFKSKVKHGRTGFMGEFRGSGTSKTKG